MNNRSHYWANGQSPVTPPSSEGGAKKLSGDIFREPSYVEVIENHIYFYAEIQREQVLRLNKTIREWAMTFLHKANIQGTTPPNIYLHINSYGGNIFSGLSVLDEIVNCKVPVYTLIDGCCASAATLFSVAGKRRLINRHGFMLIHQMSSFMWGKYSEFQDEMKNMDKLMEVIKSVYKEYTDVPMETIDEILEHDLWFDANKCMEYRLVDEIV